MIMQQNKIQFGVKRFQLIVKRELATQPKKRKFNSYDVFITKALNLIANDFVELCTEIQISK